MRKFHRFLLHRIDWNACPFHDVAWPEPDLLVADPVDGLVGRKGERDEDEQTQQAAHCRRLTAMLGTTQAAPCFVSEKRRAPRPVASTPRLHKGGKYKASLQTEEMMDSHPETQCPRRHRTGKLGSLNIKAPTIMKTTLPTASIAAALAMSCVSAFAENTPGYNEEIPADIMTPDTVETSIGTLNPIVS